MALFDNKKPFSYDVIREGDDVILSVNLEDYPKIPSIDFAHYLAAQIL